MKFFVWGRTPWNQDVLLHASWDLLWLSVIAGLLFLIGHALYVRFWAKPEPVGEPSGATGIPDHVPRHTLAARLFHWIMAAAMFVLLFTSFLPIIGVKFAWVTIHWIAGVVLTLSVIYHIVHASIWLNFWSIWPTKDDLDDASRRVRLALGQPAATPRKHPKYPLENKLYHGIIMLTGIAAIGTGIAMMARVRTPFWTRNPYLFSDAAWGVTYVLHGLTSISLVALVMVHVYFAVRPEKWWITNSMIFGWIARRYYLAHHDPTRWVVNTESHSPAHRQGTSGD